MLIPLIDSLAIGCTALGVTVLLIALRGLHPRTPPGAPRTLDPKGTLRRFLLRRLRRRDSHGCQALRELRPNRSSLTGSTRGPALWRSLQTFQSWTSLPPAASIQSIEQPHFIVSPESSRVLPAAGTGPYPNFRTHASATNL